MNTHKILSFTQSIVLRYWVRFSRLFYKNSKRSWGLLFYARLLFTISTALRTSARRIAIASLLIPAIANAQCDSISGTLNWRTPTPTFIQLFNEGYCLTDSISDTTLCFTFYPEGFLGHFRFGFSSPLGFNLNVTAINLYDSNCQLVNTGEFFPNNGFTYEPLTVCYTIRTPYVDNFCPYFLPFSGLAVEFGNAWATVTETNVTAHWETHSEANSHYFIVQVSKDLLNWIDVSNVPAAGNSSLLRTYASTFSSPYYGLVYMRICEVDLSDNKGYSEPIMYDYIPKWNLIVHRFGNYGIDGRLMK